MDAWGICRRIILSTVVLAAVARASGEPDDAREITARVVDEKEQPLAGVEVVLMGLGRGPMTSHSAIFAEPGDPEGEKARGWKFVTDANGRCTIRLGKFDFWKHLETTSLIEPGYGSYFLVATKDKYAGGVSPKLL